LKSTFKNEMTLDLLARDQPGRVVDIRGAGALCQRLLAMGFLPGTELRIVQVAPFGDPITVELNGWRVSLRRADASAVGVRPETAPAPGRD
jgi:Fe2+ transport system protein FeoA